MKIKIPVKEGWPSGIASEAMLSAVVVVHHLLAPVDTRFLSCRQGLILLLLILVHHCTNVSVGLLHTAGPDARIESNGQAPASWEAKHLPERAPTNKQKAKKAFCYLIEFIYSKTKRS